LKNSANLAAADAAVVVVVAYSLTHQYVVVASAAVPRFYLASLQYFPVYYQNRFEA
jgi:hypothetical protein